MSRLFRHRPHTPEDAPPRTQWRYIVCTVVILTLLSWLVMQALETARQRELAHAINTLNNLSKALEEHTAATVGKIDAVLRAKVDDLHDLRQQRRLEPAIVNQKLAQGLKLIPESQSLRVVGPDGYFRYDASGIISPVNVRDRAYFRTHQHNPNPGLVVSEPIFARVTSNWVITLSRQLEREHDQYTGLVQAAVRADYFHELFRQMVLHDGGVITLLDHEGRLIARYPEAPAFIGKTVRSPEMLSALRNGQREAVFEGNSPVDGVRRWHAYRQVKDYPFLILVGNTEEAILGEWQRIRAGVLAGLAVFSCVLLTLVWFWQRAHARLHQLARDMSHHADDSHSRLRALLDSLPDLAWIADHRLRFHAVNQAYAHMTGRMPEDIIGKTAHDVWPLELANQLDAQDREALLRNEAVQHEMTVPKGTQPRILECVHAPVRNAGGQLVGVAGIARDITERKAVEERIRHLADHDPLTHLPNRSLLQHRIDQILGQQGSRPVQMALLFIDLDHFKTINDTLGHDFGDRLLRQVAERLRACVREEDTVARQGGDEFVVVSEDVSGTADIDQLAQRIIATISLPYLIEGHELNVSASIGISLYPQDGTDLNALLKNADAAMYAAKSAGRAGFRYFTPEMNAHAFERLVLESSLRKAVSRHELEPYYQAIVDLASGRILRAEALLRWHHPELGMVSPGRFIPIAEETGLIVTIGEQVLRRACRDCLGWQQAGQEPVGVSVNLSMVQFRRRNIVQIVAGALAESGLNPACLELEITESALMEDPEQVIDTLNELKQLGVRLSVDDFGTGYSSLSYLRRLPLDKLKIDQSFVRDLDNDADDEAITQAIIALAQALDLDIVAEGIETEAQRHILLGHGCQVGQGYLFARPESLAAFRSRLLGTQATVGGFL